MFILSLSWLLLAQRIYVRTFVSTSASRFGTGMFKFVEFLTAMASCKTLSFHFASCHLSLLVSHITHLCVIEDAWVKQSVVTCSQSAQGWG